MSPTPPVTDITTYDDDDGFLSALRIAVEELEQGGFVELYREQPIESMTTTEWRVRVREAQQNYKLGKNTGK